MACACLDTSRRRWLVPKTRCARFGEPRLLRRGQAHATIKPKWKLTKRNIGKERAAALDRLPTRPLFLLPMKSCVVKTFVLALSLF